MKKCPYCAEEIQDEAIKCRYCKRVLIDEIPERAEEHTAYKTRMTFPYYWLFVFLSQMGWPRKTGLLIRKEVVNVDVLWESLIQLVRAGIALGTLRPKIAISLFADLYAEGVWRRQPAKELWNKLDLSKQIADTSDKAPEEVIVWVKPHFDKIGQHNNILKDVVEWEYIGTDGTFVAYFHLIFVQGLIWGLSHPEEALARWEKQRKPKSYVDNLMSTVKSPSKELLRLFAEYKARGLSEVQEEQKTMEESADAMEESVNVFQKDFRPLAKIPRELLSFPLIAARLRSLTTMQTIEIKPATAEGDGSSIEKAVVINATSTSIGRHEEYAYVERVCGERDVDWTLRIQGLDERGGRKYDVLEIEMKDGLVRRFWFDITSFFGKL